MLRLYLDADACPVKTEAYRVAARFAMPVFVVTSQAMRDPGIDGVTLVIVPNGPDIADDWIAAEIDAGDLCVSDDIPLADRCVRKGAYVLTARGRLLHSENIGELLATRDLLERLRNQQLISQGQGGGPPPFTKRDRSRFLESLDQAVRKIKSAVTQLTPPTNPTV
jgi:uncharacterized protein